MQAAAEPAAVANSAVGQAGQIAAPADDATI